MEAEIKRFVIYCFATFCASFGFMTSYIFIPVFAKSIGASMAEIGIIGATYFIVTTPMMYLLGRLSDFQDLRRRFIILGFLGSSIVYTLLAISNSTLQLVILMASLGMATSAYLPSMLALVSEEASKMKTGLKMGFYNASISAGFGMGGISGGVMGDILGISAAFFFCGIILAFGSLIMFLVFKIKNEKEKNELHSSFEVKTRRESFSLEIPTSFNALINSQLVKSGMLALCIVIFLRNSGFRGLTNFLPLYLIDLGASNSLMAMIISMNFILQFFLMPLAGWLSDLIGRKVTISIGVFSSFIALFLFSFITDPFDAIPIQILVAFGWSLMLTSANAYVADFVPKSKRGGGMGLIRTSQDLGGVVGPVIAGLLIHMYSYRIMLQTLMVFPLIGSILSYSKLKKRS